MLTLENKSVPFSLLVVGQKADLKLKGGRLCLKRELIEQGGEGEARKAFEAYYSAKGDKRISQRVAYLAPTVGVNPSVTTVKELGYRWASCTKNNSLAFHWKCMMAPPKIIDYMVVHELCHMHQRNHSDAFWNEVDKICLVIESVRSG